MISDRVKLVMLENVRDLKKILPLSSATMALEAKALFSDSAKLLETVAA